MNSFPSYRSSAASESGRALSRAAAPLLFLLPFLPHLFGEGLANIFQDLLDHFCRWNFDLGALRNDRVAVHFESLVHESTALRALIYRAQSLCVDLRFDFYNQLVDLGLRQQVGPVSSNVNVLTLTDRPTKAFRMRSTTVRRNPPSLASTELPIYSRYHQVIEFCSLLEQRDGHAPRLVPTKHVLLGLTDPPEK